MISARTLVRTPLALALLAGVTVLLALALLPGRGEAQGASVNIAQITLTPGEEVPPVTVNAIGYFSATVTANSMTFDLSANGDSFTMAHIHLGAKGANGPVVAFLYGPAEGTNAIHPTGTLTVTNLVGPLAGNWAGFADALKAGNLYVNAHSVAFPAGSVRAQIPATTAPAAATPAATPKPPSTGQGLTTGSGVSGAAIAGILLVIAATSVTGWQVARRQA